jgi:hypothetical protein
MANCSGIFHGWYGPLQPQPELAETMHGPVKPKHLPLTDMQVCRLDSGYVV